LHHVQALWAKAHVADGPPVATQARLTSQLAQITGLRAGDLLDALIRSRFFSGSPDPATTLAVREAMFAQNYLDRGRQVAGTPCRIKAPGFGSTRALLVRRGESPEGVSEAMIDHDLMTCVSRELIEHRTGCFFIPIRFWLPYGFWTEKDGSKVLFSRDYCPLWRIQEDQAPIRDDPDRAVNFVAQSWFFDEGSFRGPLDTVMARGLDILRDNRVVSMPRLAEWVPETLVTRKWISDLKRWPGDPEVARVG
jgi:hypothetical protein